LGQRQRPLESCVMPNSFANFYRGKRVLVTGHTGFKGGWLTAWLKSLGANVVGFALPPDTNPNLFDAICLGREMVSILGDIRELSVVSSVFRQHSPEIVFHNAAQPLVRRSYREPVETYATNVMGTVHVLEAVRNTPSVRSVVVVTSDKCYENREWFWGYREEDALGGPDPYSSSKGCAELVTAAYRQSFFDKEDSAAIATARAGNVIGGGDWSEDRLIPDIVRGVVANQPIVIRRPDSVRPWQHVLEPVHGYLLLAQRLWDDRAYAEPWNFGPREEDAIPVGEIAKHMVSAWGKGELRIQPDPDAPHEAHFLRLNTTKARTRLQWQSVLSLDQAVSWTADWYRKFADDPASASTITAEQIRRYAEAAGV
jgi:CDP-glucose 4,6-dehydratase